ncbi:calcium/calmodulin-dependent 3',5'-cyclic nucleotide phosphodiesterase 1 [Nilaparvata lugens]|uniref:calcium/calmodulin-dependent 3',5'-cyclic nucleotide phosphodiesterase 1 n=1 Tax=Nilaparvata lugens TaxID=108931 RepID=UPI00193D5066|nr:calcium/calmodulin-dependent 3',5'-cyclic nucleotide phosphodiesterase 1 [Nilaparvata lugens]
MTENTPLSPRRQRAAPPPTPPTDPGGTAGGGPPHPGPPGPNASGSKPPPGPPGAVDKRLQKIFKKCESATFQLDGAIYTIGGCRNESLDDNQRALSVASPPERAHSKDDGIATSPSKEQATPNQQSVNQNGQLNKQGSLTIVRRSSTKKQQQQQQQQLQSPSSEGPRAASVSEEVLKDVDLETENLPPIDTPDACDKAALRLRCLLKQLRGGEISADVLQKNLEYAAKVLEAVFIDETKSLVSQNSVTTDQLDSGDKTLRPKIRSRRLADEDDELSEVQPDAVPQEVREWLASTFTRQLATTRRKNDEKPKFKSVAHAIRAGIFVDRIYRRVVNTTAVEFPMEVVKILKLLDEWSFDVFQLNEAANGQPVKYLGYDLLNRYGILHKFKVNPQTMENFLNKIEEGYCKYKNPYHNNLHAADVAQSIHYMLCQTGLMNWLTDLEIYATLIAALIHDYEHTGTTNNFHVMSGTETALVYNDRAVLENHHISSTFRLLREDENNILHALSRAEFREFRSLVIDMVLATDMSSHFQQIKNMKNLLSLAEPSVDKSKALSLVLHCCDISHPSKRWDLHHQWTSLLLEEFFRQGDKENELGLPFSPLCDRKNTFTIENSVILIGIFAGFIDFIVDPSMSVCSDMLEVILTPILGQQDAQPNDEHHKSNKGEPLCETPGTFVLKKPWIACLAENKRIWKEKAAQDAEARAAAAAAEEADKEKSEKSEE